MSGQLSEALPMKTNTTWQRITGGDATLYRQGRFTIISSSGRTGNHDRTGYKAGNIALFVDPDPTATNWQARNYGRLICTFSKVADAKARAAREV